MGTRGLCVAVVVVLGLTGCAAVDDAGAAMDKAAVCAEALGLADLNPLIDEERLRERAEDKERRLRELAGSVADQDVKASLLGLADSYLQVQRERLDDAGVVARWAQRTADRLDALRTACT